jgi:UTP--glucose-1-phosphate uridylyltransferase
VKFRKAIIPMAAPYHRSLPLQQLVVGPGQMASVVVIQVLELLTAGIEQVALIVGPGARVQFSELEERFGRAVVFIEQPHPKGFGDAVLCAESWVGGEEFVVQVCDHVFITHSGESCVRQLLEAAERERCPISAVQETHESQLPYFGVVGGQRVRGEERLVEVDMMLEKPTPTTAEVHCVVPGMRQGSYLGFFGVHALTAGVFGHLRRLQSSQNGAPFGLTEALALVHTRERYLALEIRGRRVDLQGSFGLLRAQLALSFSGPQREEAFGLLLEEVAQARRAQR